MNDERLTIVITTGRAVSVKWYMDTTVLREPHPNNPFSWSLRDRRVVGRIGKASRYAISEGEIPDGSSRASQLSAPN